MTGLQAASVEGQDTEGSCRKGAELRNSTWSLEVLTGLQAASAKGQEADGSRRKGDKVRYHALSAITHGHWRWCLACRRQALEDRKREEEEMAKRVEATVRKRVEEAMQTQEVQLRTEVRLREERAKLQVSAI